jgi:hypothetical protein
LQSISKEDFHCRVANSFQEIIATDAAQPPLRKMAFQILSIIYGNDIQKKVSTKPCKICTSLWSRHPLYVMLVCSCVELFGHENWSTLCTRLTKKGHASQCQHIAAHFTLLFMIEAAWSNALYLMYITHIKFWHLVEKLRMFGALFPNEATSI